MRRFITVLLTCLLFSIPVLADEPAIVLAAESSDLAKIKVALASGEDVNAVGDGGANALMWASKNNHIEIVDFLLSKGADVNAKDSAGYTALIYTGDITIAADLINHGADVHVRTKNKNTPLIIAVKNGQLDMVKLLLDNGVRVDVKDAGGCTALMFAAQKEDAHEFDIAKYLIDHGANVNAKDDEDHTPLMSAAETGHGQIVQLLLDNGANKNAKDSEDMSALDYAKEEGHEEVIALLK